MAIRIPESEPQLHEPRLTRIKIISALHSRYVDEDTAGNDKTAVKDVMREKRVRYAHSDHVIAALKPSGRGTIDARGLYELVRARAITIDQFLECVTIRRKPLEQHLPGETIDKLTSINVAGVSLTTEFRPGVVAHLDRLAELLELELATAPAA